MDSDTIYIKTSAGVELVSNQQQHCKMVQILSDQFHVPPVVTASTSTPTITTTNTTTSSNQRLQHYKHILFYITSFNLIYNLLHIIIAGFDSQDVSSMTTLFLKAQLISLATIKLYHLFRWHLFNVIIFTTVECYTLQLCTFLILLQTFYRNVCPFTSTLAIVYLLQVFVNTYLIGQLRRFYELDQKENFEPPPAYIYDPKGTEVKV